MATNNAPAIVNPFANTSDSGASDGKPCEGVATLSSDGKLTVTTDMGNIAAQLAAGFGEVQAPLNSKGNKSIAYGQGRWSMPDGSKVMVSCSVTLVAPKSK